MMKTSSNIKGVAASMGMRRQQVAVAYLTLACLLVLSLQTRSTAADAAFVSQILSKVGSRQKNGPSANLIFSPRASVFRASIADKFQTLYMTNEEEKEDGERSYEQGNDNDERTLDYEISGIFGSDKLNRPTSYVGHDYVLVPDAGPISPLCRFTPEQIHDLIARRGQCKRRRNFAEADQILDGLVRAGVHLHDKRQEWRADGESHFGRTILYVRRGDTFGLSEDDLTTISAMVETRSRAKKKREFHVSDGLEETLKAKYSVKVNDKKREWSILLLDDNDSVVQVVYVPSPLAPLDDPTHLISDESRAFIQQRLMDRMAARKNKDYAMADSIRDALLQDYSVVVDDRTKEWKVVTSSLNGDDDAFLAEAQASQRSAFVRKNSAVVTHALDVEEEDDVRTPFQDDGSRSSDISLASSNEKYDVVPVRSVEEAIASTSDQDEGALDETLLATHTVVVLKEKLRVAGLPVSGKKAELIQRLVKTASSKTS